MSHSSHKMIVPRGFHYRIGNRFSLYTRNITTAFRRQCMSGLFNCLATLYGYRKSGTDETAPFPGPLTFLSTICVSAISDPMDSDRLWGFIEQYAVIAHAQPQKPLELAVQCFYWSLARTRVGVNRTENLQSGGLIDGPYLGGYIRPEANLLHGPC